MSRVISRSRTFLLRQVIHQVEHQLFKDHAQSARANLAGQCLAGDGADGFLRKVQADILELEEALVLLDDRVARLGEDFDQRGLVQLIENAHDRQTTDELGNQAVLDEVLRLGLAEQLGVAM